MKKLLKRVAVFVIMVCICISLFSCGKKKTNVATNQKIENIKNENSGSENINNQSETAKANNEETLIPKKETKSREEIFKDAYKKKKVAVIYFSCTGNTKLVAEKISKVFDCDMIEIVPEEAYTEYDLTSYNEDTRPMREKAFNPFMPPEMPDDEIQNGTRKGAPNVYVGDGKDKVVDEENSDEKLDSQTVETTEVETTASSDDVEAEDDIAKNSINEKQVKPVTELPKIKKINIGKYDTIFLGYPIWFSDAPRVIYTFVGTMDLNKKTIIPFCTSGSDDISPSDQDLANYGYMNSDTVYFMEGKRWSVNATETEIKDWATTVGVNIDIR